MLIDGYTRKAKKANCMKGFQFSKFLSAGDDKTEFEKMLDIFMQLLNHTSGNASEALEWMTELDKEYQFTLRNMGWVILLTS